MRHLIVYRKSDGAIQRVITRTNQNHFSLTALGFNPVLYDTCRVVTGERLDPSKWRVENNNLVRLISKEQELVKEFTSNVDTGVEGYRIVFVGDLPSANTGFGTQYKILKEGLLRRGHTVQHVKYPNIPQLVDIDCDFVIALSDYGSVRAIFDLGLHNFLYWFALESPEWPVEWDENLRKVPTVIPLTKYGADALRRKEIECEEPIPHGVSSEVFKPIPVRQRGILRKQNEVDNKFVVSYIGTNVSRKRLDLLVKTYAKFVKEYDFNSESVLLLKSKINGYYNLEKLIIENSEEYELPNLVSQVRLIEKEMTGQEVNQFINISDVGLNTTSGEGFCVPVIEYLMCGVPFIAGRHTSFPELIGNIIPLISVEDITIDNRFKWTRFNIDVVHAVNIIAQYYDYWKNGKIYDRVRLRDVAMQYTSEAMVAKWDKLLRDSERKQIERESIKRAASSLLQVESSKKDQRLYEKATQAVESPTITESQEIKWIKVF